MAGVQIVAGLKREDVVQGVAGEQGKAVGQGVAGVQICLDQREKR